jgi:hypothetical protein
VHVHLASASRSTSAPTFTPQKIHLRTCTTRAITKIPASRNKKIKGLCPHAKANSTKQHPFVSLPSFPSFPPFPSHTSVLVEYRSKPLAEQTQMGIPPVQALSSEKAWCGLVKRQNLGTDEFHQGQELLRLLPSLEPSQNFPQSPSMLSRVLGTVAGRGTTNVIGGGHFYFGHFWVREHDVRTGWMSRRCWLAGWLAGVSE